MPRPLLPLLSLALLMLAAPAFAIVEEKPRWYPTRRPGGAMEDPPEPPSGWRLGLSMTSPWAFGPTLGYVWQAAPIGVKVGGTWGAWTDRGWLTRDLRDARLYGALMYYMAAPTFAGGPYFEAGVGLAESSGGVRPLGWPVVPHAGFGTTGRFADGGGWDLTFAAAANGLVAFEAAMLF